MDKVKFNVLLEEYAIAYRELKACCTPDDHMIAYNIYAAKKQAIFDFLEKPPISKSLYIMDLPT